MVLSVPKVLQAGDIILFTKFDQITVFVKETSACTVIDTACSGIVCSATWLTQHLDQ